MAATYTVTFRNDDEWDIEDVDRFEATAELLTALDEGGDVVAVFPIQSLTGIVRYDEDDDGGDDDESADVIHLDESKLGPRITNHFPTPGVRLTKEQSRAYMQDANRPGLKIA